MLNIFWVYYWIIQYLAFNFGDKNFWFSDFFILVYIVTLAIAIIIIVGNIYKLKTGYYLGWKKLAENIVKSGSNQNQAKIKSSYKNYSELRPKFKKIYQAIQIYAVIFVFFNFYYCIAYIINVSDLSGAKVPLLNSVSSFIVFSIFTLTEFFISNYLIKLITKASN